MFRSIRKNGALWGEGLTQNVISLTLDSRRFAASLTTYPVENWSKSNFCSVTHQSKPLSVISAASSVSAKL
jgi:hypothetical protein